MKAFSAKMSWMFPATICGRPTRLVSSRPTIVAGLVGAVAQLEQRAAGVERDRILDAGDAAHLVEHVVRQRNGVGDGLNGRVHHPDGGADVDDRGRGAVQDAGEERSHLDHQEDGERDPDEERREFRAVVHQELVGDSEDSGHCERHVGSMAIQELGAVGMFRSSARAIGKRGPRPLRGASVGMRIRSSARFR